MPGSEERGEERARGQGESEDKVKRGSGRTGRSVALQAADAAARLALVVVGLGRVGEVAAGPASGEKDVRRGKGSPGSTLALSRVVLTLATLALPLCVARSSKIESVFEGEEGGEEEQERRRTAFLDLERQRRARLGLPAGLLRR